MQKVNNALGEKIKNLRLQKMMTQKELCGNKITRNMLSAIENGYALPSIDTLVFIAEKLNVSPGILLAENNNDFSFKKIAIIDSIRQAFKRESYSICIDLCADLPEDDEINHILGKSYLALAKDSFDRGVLHEMCNYLDKAVYHSENSTYSDCSTIAIASRYIKYANSISQTLFSYSISDDRTWKDDISSLQDEFCRYLFVIESLQTGRSSLDLDRAVYNFSNPQYVKHISAIKKINDHDLEGAMVLFKELIYSQTELAIPIMYNIMHEAELCSKELNNYKDAYEFSNSCITLLDSILKQ